MLEYRGYYCVPQYSEEDSVCWGKIEGISSLVTFESEQECNIELEFHNAVDDYLAIKTGF